MDKVIMVGCDAHSKSLMLMCAVGKEKPEKRQYENSKRGRRKMISELKSLADKQKTKRIVLAYEASSLGFGLHDELRGANVECHVLAPTKMEWSPQQRRTKTDENDAMKILEVVRGYILAGNSLPDVWIPDVETRDDREAVRMRLDVADKVTSIKNQIQSLLKRNSVCRPKEFKSSWTKKHEKWLAGLSKEEAGGLGFGARTALKSLLRQKKALEDELAELDEDMAAMAETLRYAEPVRDISKETGVNSVVAMVYLAELGDLSRFTNRREVGAYIGIAPSSFESGENDDRKGHITHQGPWRVRKVLCQAAWAIVRCGSPEEKAAYARLVKRNPKHKKIAVVALMRRLAIRLWHIGKESQEKHGCFRSEK